MKTVFNPITVGLISKGLNGSMQVELRQIIDNQYDDSNSHNDALFEGTRATYHGTRVAWRTIPEDATPETVKAQLALFPEAVLYRILSLKPVMNDAQKRVYHNGFIGTNGATAFADFKAKNKLTSTVWDAACKAAFAATVEQAQLVKYGAGSTEGKEGDPILFNLQKQYKVIAFSQTAKADIDLRIEKAITTQGVDLAPVRENVTEIVTA